MSFFLHVLAVDRRLMNVSAVTLRLLLIITAYMDDLLHEDTNIFFCQ